MARKKKLDDFHILNIVELLETTRESKCSIAKKFSICRSSLYKYLNEYYTKPKKEKK